MDVKSVDAPFFPFVKSVRDLSQMLVPFPDKVEFVVAFELSNSIDPAFCITALLPALKISRPQIFNTDQ